MFEILWKHSVKSQNRKWHSFIFYQNQEQAGLDTIFSSDKRDKLLYKKLEKIREIEK